MMIRLGLGAVLTTLCISACTAPADEVASSEERQTEVKALTVVKITAATINSPAEFTAIGTDLDIETGGTTVVGSVPRSSFPVMILLGAELTRAGIDAIGLKRTAGWSNKVTIQRPEDMSASHPQSIGQPFDLWPIAFIDTRGDWAHYAVNAKEYKRSVAPYSAFVEPDELTLQPAFSTRDFEGKATWWVAPASGGIEVTVQSPGPVLTVDGPGYYAMTNEGFRRAKPEEIALDFGAAPEPGTGTTEPGTGTTEPGTGTTEPSAPVDTDPTCGGDQQRPCGQGEARACDAGTRAISNGTCTKCGNHGQITCFVDPKGLSSAAGLRCNEATRQTSDNTCRSCGADGQITCFVDPNGASSAQGLKCNPGTRQISSGTCAACGAEGKLACFVDPNGASSAQGLKCNDGLRVSGNGTCVR